MTSFSDAGEVQQSALPLHVVETGRPCGNSLSFRKSRWATRRTCTDDLREQKYALALSISDAGECAFVRFLLSHPEQGREILERAGLAIIESDLIGVELPEDSSPCANLRCLHRQK